MGQYDNLIPLIAYEISGVKIPTYDSGAVNYHLLQQVSGGLKAKILGSTGVEASAFTSFSAGTGITAFGSTYKISGSVPLTITVDQGSILTTVSSNAKTTMEWYTESSQKISQFITSGDEYTKSYEWFTESSSKLSDFASSGDKYSKAYLSGSIFGQSYTWMEESGQKYTNAYASAQILKDGAFKEVRSGWAYVSSQGKIPHGCSSKPNNVIVMPSGLVTFSIATKVDETNITVFMTASQKRTVSWRAEV